MQIYDFLKYTPRNLLKYLVEQKTVSHVINIEKIRVDLFKKVPKRYISSSSPVSISCTENNSVGAITYTLINNTQQMQSVAIYRGVPGYSPIYFFGGAFGVPVYIANGLAQPCVSVQQEMCLGILTYNSIPLYPAFVFNIPPNQAYQVTEYGFPPNANLVLEPVLLKPSNNVNNYLVYYDPSLVSIYEQEAGVNVASSPDPTPYTSLSFSLPRMYPNIFGYLVVNNNFLTNNPFFEITYFNILLTFPITLQLI